MNEKRQNKPRRADRFADRTPVEEIEGQLEQTLSIFKN